MPTKLRDARFFGSYSFFVSYLGRLFFITPFDLTLTPILVNGE